MTEHIARAGMPEEAALLGLRETLRGEMLRPGDTEYDATRGIWNGMIDRRPSLIVRCHGVADVIAAVNFARDQGLLVAVRGGGHGVAGHAVCDGGMMIDLSSMRAVRVDPEVRRAWVQGGATWGDVDCETTVLGLATPGGLISTTGVGGLTLSGGAGWLRGTAGLCVDNVISADVVPPTAGCCEPPRQKIRTSIGLSGAAAVISALSSASSSSCDRSNRS